MSNIKEQGPESVLLNASEVISEFGRSINTLTARREQAWRDLAEVDARIGELTARREALSLQIARLDGSIGTENAWRDLIQSTASRIVAERSDTGQQSEG